MNHLLQFILPSILGDYIKDIDKNKMKTSLFSGTVGLEGVSLNPKILKSFDLPIKMEFSRIGKLEVKIPWMKRLKEPTEITLEDMLVLIVPTKEMKDFNIMKERIKFLDRLLEECIEKMKGIERDENEDKKDGESRYKALIIDNLQLTIKNIHIRFENPKEGYSTGITLDSISIHTIDQGGQPKFFDRTLKENKNQDMHKKAMIKDLAIYWNSDEQANKFVSGENIDQKAKISFLLDNILRSEKKKKEIEPLLMISLSSTLTIKNLSKTTVENQPRYTINISLQPIKVKFTSKQFNQILGLGDLMKKVKMSRGNKYELPDMSDTETNKMASYYKESILKSMEDFDESSFKWAEVLKKSSTASEVVAIRSYLTKLPNKVLIEATKEALIQGLKNSLMKKIEKKFKKKKSEYSEEMNKLQEFFESFDQESSNISIESMSMEFLLQINFLLSEAVIEIDNSETQHGILCSVKTMSVIFESIKSEDADIMNIKLGIKDSHVEFIQKYSNSEQFKKYPIIKRSSMDDNRNLLNLLIQKKTMNKQDEVEINGNFERLEFRFMAEFIITLKTLLTIDHSQGDSEFRVEAYETLADMQKNAENQIKSMLHHYYSFMNVSLKCSKITIILPLNPKLLDDSDSWILGIESIEVGTKLDPNADKKTDKYSRFYYQMMDINVRYYPKVTTYYNEFNGNVDDDENEVIVNFLDKTTVRVDLNLLKNSYKMIDQKSNEVEVGLTVGRIEIDMNKFIYHKLVAIRKCFDFSHEKDMNEYLETEKHHIIRHQDGMFKVYCKDNFSLASEWQPYFGVVSGFYFYLYKNNTDLKYAKYIFIRKAKCLDDTKKYDHAYVTKVKGRYDEMVLAFENESMLTKFKGIISKKQSKLHHQLTSRISEDLSHVSGHEDIVADDLSKTLIFFVITFDGLTLNLKEEKSIRTTNQIVINSLAINISVHPLDILLKLTLKELFFLDFEAEKYSPEYRNLISSRQSQNEESTNLVTFDIIVYNEEHPFFKEKNNMTEFILKFNYLNVLWMPDRIFFLKTFFEGLFDEKKAPLPGIGLSPVSSNDSDQPVTPVHIKTVDETLKAVKISSGKIAVNQMSVTLITRESNIQLAKLSLSNLNMGVDFFRDHQIFEGSLQNAQIFDLTNYQQGPLKEINPFELIGAEAGESVLKFKFERRNDDYLDEHKTKFANDLKVNCSSLKLTYIHQPVMRIVTYVTNFVLSFKYGEALSFQQQQLEAITTISNSNFNNIEVKFDHPKIMLVPAPASKVAFEIDLGIISIQNKIAQKNDRILKKLELDYLQVEEYKISMSKAKISKVIQNGDRFQITNEFNLNILFERCLMYEEYILYTGIPQTSKYENIDNSYNIQSVSDEILFRITQEDYLDFMDVALMNLAYDDMKDAKYHVDEELVIEMKEATKPTPIKFSYEAPYVSMLTIDQTVKYPLAKLMTLVNKITFERKRDLNKEIKMSFGKVALSYFDMNNEYESLLDERILIGEIFSERVVPWKIDIDFTQKIYDKTLLHADKIDLKKYQNVALTIQALLDTQGNKDISIDIINYKMILNIEKLMRLKDFLLFNNRIVSDDSEIDQLTTPSSRKMLAVKLIMKASEIFLPGSIDSAIIFKGNIILDLQKYDPNDCKLMQTDFLITQDLTLSVYDFESFAINTKASTKKRSIIMPVVLTYKTKELMVFEKQGRKFVSKLENDIFLDRTTVRIGASDTTTLWAAAERLMKDYETVKKLPAFPKFSKLTDHTREEQDLNESISFVVFQQTRILKQGLQIYIINDISGVSIPVFYISFTSNTSNNEILLQESNGVKSSKFGFHISCLFFNTRQAYWEPLLESWPFKIEYDLYSKSDFSNRVEVVTSHTPFNIDISDEMLGVAFTAYYDWKNHFELNKQSKILKRLDYSIINQGILKEMTLEENDIEKMSICKVWNDTGFEMHLEAAVAAYTQKKSITKSILDLKTGEIKDLLINWSVGQNESMAEKGILDKIKADFRLKIPGSGDGLGLSLDIDTPGTRSIFVKIKDKKHAVLCKVYTENQKKIVRISSVVLIDNKLSFPLFIHVHDQNSQGMILEIKPGGSVSMPVDRIYNYVSFHIERNYKEKGFNTFSLPSFNNYKPLELSFCKKFAIILPIREFLYDKVIVEPIYVIQNCLPVPLAIDVKVRDHGVDSQVVEILHPKDKILLDQYSIEADMVTRFATHTFTSNEFRINRRQNLQKQSLYFDAGRHRLGVDILRPVIANSYTEKYVIAGNCCLINDTGEELYFFTANDNGTLYSPFVVFSEDKDVILFSQLNSLQITTKSDKTNYSDSLQIPTTGDYTIDVPNKDKGFYNFAVRVTNELVYPEMNIFNKVVTVTPRYIFNNLTNFMISVFQTEYSACKYALMEKEKTIIHFRKPTKEKNIQILIESFDVSQIKWRPSGILEVSSPGDLQFICQSQDGKIVRYFNLSIVPQEQYLCLTLEEQESENCLLQIENLTDLFTIGITQSKVNEIIFAVPPKEKKPFAWINPSALNEVMFWLNLGEDDSNPIFCRFDSLDKNYREKVRFKSGNCEEFFVFFNVSIEKGVKVLKISQSSDMNKEQDLSLREWSIDIQLYSLGISLITTKAMRKCELMYFNFTPVRVLIIAHDITFTMQLEVKNLAVDNNLVGDPLYPLVLCAKTITKQSLAPAINFVITTKNRNRHGILHIENIQFYMDEMVFSLDGLTLNAISEYIRSAGEVYEKSNIHNIDYSEYYFMDQETRATAKNSLKNWFNLKYSNNKANYVYLERIKIFPIILLINYNNAMIGKDSYASSFLRTAIGKAIANFEFAEIKLSGLEIVHLYGSSTLVTQSFQKRYTELLKSAVLEIFFSSGLIGNPNKFFNKLGSGVKDLIEKPADGFLEGPIEGVVGTFHGAGSFALKTVGATFGSLHSITGSIANGLANLSFDKEYIREREEKNRKKSKNVVDGGIKAIGSIGGGLLDGFTGVFVKPIEGVSKDGVGGFFKGVVKGVTGLVVQPVTGVLDGVSKLTEGVSNNLNIDNEHDVRLDKSRYPRIFYGPQQIYKTYDERDAKIFRILGATKKKYKIFNVMDSIYFKFNWQKSATESCLWLTLEKIFFLININDNFELLWKISLKVIEDVGTDQNSVKLQLNKKKSYINDDKVAHIFIKDQNVRGHVYYRLVILRELYFERENLKQ